MLKPYIPGIGNATPRADAETKVTGVEKYAADYYGDDLLWAGVKRAGIPHGLIREVRTAKAKNLPGVVAVLTGRDVPGTNRQGIVHKDQPVLADSKVRHAGDAVALVVAEDKDTLRRGISLLEVDIEPLPGIFGIDDALDPLAPAVHEEHATGNILLKATFASGEAQKAFQGCDVVLEEIFTVPIQAHAFIETENGVAWQEPDGNIVMVVSTQAPFRDRFEIGHALGIAINRIRIIGLYLGGAFGAKDGATCPVPACPCGNACVRPPRQDVVEP